MNSHRSIEIVGGGLAGLSLGIALRRANVPVTVFEAGTYPRHRVCGEFIAGLDSETIARLGIGPLLGDALRHRDVIWFLRDEPVFEARLPSAALGTSRHELDARLAQELVALGGTLHTETRITNPVTPPGRVFATGRRRARSDWFGLKVHARGLDMTRDLELHLGDRAYVGLSRVQDGVVNICGLFRRPPSRERSAAPQSAVPSGAGQAVDPRRGGSPDVLIRQVEACGLGDLAARMEGADFDRDSFCSVAGFVFTSRARNPSDRIAIGDAYAMIPPFTGNGMAIAFQSAALAAPPLTEYARGNASWGETCRLANAALRRRFALRLTSAGIVHPFLLGRKRQRWIAAFAGARLVPFRPLFAVLH